MQIASVAESRKRTALQNRLCRNVLLRMSDIGINRTDEVRQSFTGLGSIKLIPVEHIKPCWKVLSKADRLWNQNGVYFPMVPGARYVPNTKIKELVKGFKELKEELAKEVEVLIENYEKAKEEQYPILVEAFRQACKDTKSFDEAIKRIPNLYPSPQRIRDKFYLTWKIYRLDAPLGEGMGEIAEQTSDVKDMLGGMVEKLRKELLDRSDEITQLVVKGGKISKKTYNSTNRLLDKVDGLTDILADPFIMKASKALRRAVEGAGNADSDEARNQTLLSGINEVKTELSESVEEAMAAVEKRLTSYGRKIAV